MAKRAKGKTAWLVTWEQSGDHANRKDRIAAIFRPQFSGQRIREFVDVIYQSEYMPHERLIAALNPKANPYPAQFATIGDIPWHGEVICGDNPFLRARLVDDLLIDEHGEPRWEERPRPVPTT